MQYIILIQIIFLFLIFLFTVFALSKDNFVLLRKNINTEKVFNIAFLICFFGLLFARIFFVLFHFRPVYFQPLVFFLFPYFPGLSVAGGVLSGLLFLLYYSNRNKLLPSYLLDIFSVAFLSVVPFGIILSLISAKHLMLFPVILILLDWIIVGISIFLFYKNKLKDGSVGYLSLISIALILYLFDGTQKMWITKDAFLFLIIFSIGAFFLSKQEGLIDKIRPPKKKKKTHQRFRVLSFD